MSTRDINTLRDELLKNRIELSDTISQFMEKCNNNFSAIVEWGGNPDGTKGQKGDQGVPTKPKVPIHVWRKDKEYNSEAKSPDGGFEIYDWNENLSDVKYQEGHLIMLENANIYILKSDDNFNLKPKYIVSLNSYNSDSVVNGRNAYVHFAYADSPDGKEGFKTDQELRTELGETESITTFSLTRGSNSSNSVAVDKPYMGVYSDNTQDSMKEPRAYTWFRVRGNDGLDGVNGSDGAQGPQGPKGEKGDQGDPGDAFTGHPYTIDLEGDMSTISIDIDRTRLYDKSGDYCKCIAHAYYGDENIKIDISKETTKVEVRLPEEYKYSDEIPSLILKVEDNSVVGVIEIKQANNDVEIKFIPDEEFKFPKKTIFFTVHIEDSVYDKDDGNTYNFVRDTVWMIKGIMSTFELEIMPHYRSIKLFENGDYYPEKLLVDVYKVEDSERTIFNFGQNPDFTLLYKDYNNNEWKTYPSEGVSTKGVSCLEFKVVRYLNSTDPLKPEEIWDYEDVWVVADGKSTHYYHADLGSAESMMVLTTGEKININTNENEDPLYCAKLRNEDGYSITFDLKFYDGTEELKVIDVDIYQSGADNYYYLNGTFKREIGELITETETIDEVTVTKYKSTFTVTSVPYNVEMIPMTFTVTGEVPVYDSSGNILKTIHEKDTISFYVYISTLTNTYTLIPTVSAYNTSTGKNGDIIGCNVYKNDVFINTTELSQNGLLLEYIVYDGSPEYNVVPYTEPLIYGDDSDIEENEFAAKDVAIEFILSYNGNEVAKSTVPLIKDGIDGRDGDSWQYIFCRSPHYNFIRTGISNPAKWTNDPNPNDSNSEYLGENESDYSENPNLRWYDDHKGIDSIYRYEYQSYRKWDKDNKCWGPYGEPTLYSNYSESGSGYSVLLSNPVAVIPVGSDWRTEEGNDNQYDSTLVYLYNNTSDISENANVSISIDIPADDPHYSHFTIPTKDENNKINKVNFTPVVYNEKTGESIFEFNQNTPYKVPIKLTYTLDKDNDNDGTVDNFVTTINWTLTPITGLEDVEVFVDQRVVNNSIGSQHTLRVGYYLISTNNSKQFIEEDNENNIKGYKIILTNDIKNLTPDAPDATIKNVVLAEYWTEVEYDFANNKKNRNCYVVLVEPYTNESGTVEYNIIDYTDVTSVSDGKSSIHLELTQDYIALPCDAEGGGVHRDYKDDITAQMKLYNGDILIEGNIQYHFRKNDDTTDLTQSEDTIQMVGNDGTFKISPNIINGDTNIKCIAEYNDIFYYKVLFIDLEETPYELEINKNVLTRDVNIGDGIILDDEITVSVKCWMKGDWQYIDYGEVIATTNNGETSDSFSEPSGEKMVRTLAITSSNLRSNKSDTNVKISFTYNGEELSYETIGIINGGRDGELWQYIYCKSHNHPFDTNNTTYNPALWSNESDVLKKDPNNIYLGENESEYDETSDNKWYGYPIGVDSVNKYQYQSYRKWDRSNKQWTAYSVPKLYSNYSESGSGYSALLSNPVAVIPVGADWSTNENISIQHDSTLVYLYDNISDKSKNIDIDLLNVDSNYFTKDKTDSGINIVTFTPSANVNGEVKYFEFEPNTSYKVPITVIYKPDENSDDSFSTTIDWTLTPITGLEDVEVFVNQRVVNTSVDKEHDLIVGYYLISSNNTKVFVESYDDKNNESKGYKIILTNNIGNLTPDPDTPDTSIKNVVLVEDWNGAENGAEYTFVDEDGKNRNCYVVLVEPYNDNGVEKYNIIDYIDVISVSDGKYAMHIELDQDYISLPYNEYHSGVHPKYNTDQSPIKSRIRLYNGSTFIDDYDNITYRFEENDIDVSDDISIYPSNNGTFEVLIDSIKGDRNINCIATYQGSDFCKTLVIDLEETPYELEINKNILTRDVNKGTIMDTFISVIVKSWVDGVWYTETSGYVVLKSNNVSYEFSYNSASQSYILNITDDNIKTNSDDTDFRISYYTKRNVINGVASYTNEVTYEIIGVIDSGKDGETPTLLSTTRIGFSLDKDADINNNSVWDATLDGDEYKNSSPGTPIYVLYERIWAYDNGTQHKERYVTATLSGSQGVEGKSRVLFYRGSFDSRGGKTPTLTGNYIKGILDDNRCDYYIDSEGNAWMRTGTDTSANGYSDSTENNKDNKICWVQADVVGFLQAGAIHADMINAGSIKANTGFVDKLFSLEIEAENLTVNAAKVKGELTAAYINTKNIEGKLFEGKTLQSSNTNVTLAEGTEFATFNAETGEMNEKPTTSNGTTQGPAWQLNNLGQGYLAAGHIQWKADGTAKFTNKVEIQAASIKGILEGNTIQSKGNIKLADNTTGPAWQIKPEGDGHLAKKNIWWDTNGNLTVNGKIIGGEESQLGIWNVWKDGTISTNPEANSTNPMIKFAKDGSGQLCYGNIYWKTDGTLYFGGEDKKPVYIGDAWEVNDKGITSKNDTAAFYNDGSGQIGGYYEKIKDEDIKIKKGISWDENGDVTFHNKLITKPEYIELTGNETDKKPPTIYIKSEASTYIFIEKTESEPSTYNFNQNDYYYVYLGWFNGMFDQITLDNKTLCNFTLINHTNKALKLYINENNIKLPFRRTQDWILPQYNYELMQNDTYHKYESIIQIIYILPGSKLELCLENYNNTHMFYIDNISDFRLCYDSSTSLGDEDTVARTRSLVSTNYDLNTYNNGGGYGHILSEKFTPRSQYLHLIFGNYCSGVNGSFSIPYYNSIHYRTESDSFKESVSMGSIDSNNYENYEKYIFNEVYKRPIEITCGFNISLVNNNQPFNIKLHITDNKDSLGKEYTKVQLICYSILYDTIYKGDIIEIKLNEDFNISLNEKDYKTLIWLAGNQQNPILDILVKINFIES